MGILSVGSDGESSIWERVRARALAEAEVRTVGADTVTVPWHVVLELLLDYGSRAQQEHHGFRFRIIGEAKERAARFASEVKQARAARTAMTVSLSPIEVIARLRELRFTRRSLREFQSRDLLHLLSMPHGANFSVPGAGKTTVTLALHLLVRNSSHRLLVIAPKSAFPAWREVIDECLELGESEQQKFQFVVLNGNASENLRLLETEALHFVMSYDLMVRQQAMIQSFITRYPVHLVLDEAHRMKAGFDSQRGAFLLRVAPLVARRDILTGTPMPQGPSDLESQLGFLWPGQGLDRQIQRGAHPRDVLGQLYVRTTKRELGLPPARRHFYEVDMSAGQLALYAIVRNETLRKLSGYVRAHGVGMDLLGARRSVMRLLQLSSNPILALKGIVEDVAGLKSGVIDAVLDEGASTKMRAVIEHARQLASAGRKVVIWTIFTDSILDLERALPELNPVTLYGAIPSGEVTDPNTREGRVRRFHEDDACQVLIANPAAAGEGISLHTVCHEAIYLDRSYVSTHYLQSVDRIHRLGLPPNTETNVHIYRTRAPAEIGSIDYSVSRRLAKKIRGLQELLNDVDLHEIAFDEENADDPVDYASTCRTWSI
jgi:SNF2 family DNA or RNA helicase